MTSQPMTPDRSNTQSRRILADFLGPALAAGVLLVAAGCGPGSRGSDAQQDAPRVRVAIGVAGAGRDADKWILGGQVRALEEATVRATLAARITSFPVAEGNAFRAGDVLVVFGATEAREAVRSAAVRAEAARLRDEEAARQTRRVDSLFVRGVVALRDRDLARQDAQLASAERAAAVAAFEQARAGANVRAPFAGTVIRRLVEAGADVVAGQPLLELHSASGEEIAVALPESRAARLTAMHFEIEPGPGGAWIPARMSRSEGAFDPATRTRTVYLRADPAVPLAPGAFVRVRLAMGGTTRIVVPTASLVRRGGLTGVYVVRDGRAGLRWVRPGQAEGGATEILAGLDAGEAFALDPAGLVDGARVDVRP
jgi:RND family efflux transporter MFP subunit